ncbi:MAG: 30S ribosomal protein S13 [bacterium]|nr:30S ribosomal protein S13 [bacterium]MDZ4295991.1 30S ribosomal protein S13 [Patescibacteria group bacterium]
MPRILGVNIPDQKRADIALTAIYGVGRVTSARILREAHVEAVKRARDLSPEEIRKITDIIQQRLTIEGDLRRTQQMDIKRLKDIGSWRGMRHARRLPVRGQHTRTNTRTVRGNVRRTTTSGRRKVDKK